MISIIITAYKEHNTIAKAIESFLSQKINQNHEIVVVAPDKETINAAKKYKNIKIIKDENKGKPSALNMAFSRCKKSDILVLTDGDVYVSDSSVNKLVKCFNDKSVGAATGRPVSLNPKNNIYGYWSHLLTDVGAHETRLKLSKKNKFITCSGYLMAIKNNIIEKIPDNALSDDAVISNLIYSKGYRIAYSPESIVYVKYPDNFKDWIKQKRRSTGGYLQIKKFAYRRDSMRSFTKESLGILRVFSYPKNFKEILWTLLLIIARLYLWFVIFVNLKIFRKNFFNDDGWERIESTKHLE